MVEHWKLFNCDELLRIISKSTIIFAFVDWGSDVTDSMNGRELERLLFLLWAMPFEVTRVCTTSWS